MLSENESQATDTSPTTDNGAPLILTTPPLLKSPSEQSIISKNLESLDLASSTTPRDYTQALTKILSAPGKPGDGEKKGSKVKSMFMVLSPFKVKNEQSPILGRAPSPTPPVNDQQETSTAAKNKKDCSITVKVFEARNLPEARQRRKSSVKNSKAFHRAQKILLEVSSPNLMNFSDATDPYCMVQVEKLKMRTRTIERKLNPFWCEEFTFEVLDAATSKVVLTIIDDKKYSQQDEVIGRLVLPINSFRDQREHEQWLPIQLPHSTNKIPQIHMYVNYEQANGDKKATFNFQVLGGRNLGIGPNGGPIPYLDFALKMKDGTVKEESWFWPDIHTSMSERELGAPLEMLNITLWRWKGQFDDEEEEPVANPPASSSLSTSPSTNGSERKKLILGNISIPVLDLSGARDSWYCLYGKDAGLGDVRVKIKYTEEVVLTLEQYREFLELLTDPKLRVVHTLGHVAKPNTREGIAYNLVRVFEKLDKAVLLLNGLTGEETDSTPNPDVIFRGNSLATKSVDQYMKLVGMPWMNSVLKALIKKLYMSNRSCEVDPTKLEKGEDLKQNWKNLIHWVNVFTESIFESLARCPLTLRHIFNGMQQKCIERFPGDIARYTAVSGFIFLRFFCPAILAPKLFGLAPDHPGIKQTRFLILIAKTLQNLANLVEFGSVKEEFMKNMNEFVVANMENMRNFIDKLATVPDSATLAAQQQTAKIEKPIVPTAPAGVTGESVMGGVENINLEKELASMYRHLLRHRDEMDEYCTTKGDPEGLETMEKLKSILTKLETQVKEANENEHTT